MITANTNSLYGHQLDKMEKWRERFGQQFPQFFRIHKLTVEWTKLRNFRRVFVYLCHHVDPLGKPPSKEQQLSRTQQFILSSQATMFVLTHTIWPMRNTAVPYDTTTELSPINILPFKENY